MKKLLPLLFLISLFLITTVSASVNCPPLAIRNVCTDMTLIGSGYSTITCPTACEALDTTCCHLDLNAGATDCYIGSAPLIYHAATTKRAALCTTDEGFACSTDTDCGSGNCRVEIDGVGSYCAAIGKNCSNEGAAGYDNGESEGNYICTAQDTVELGDVLCETVLSDTYYWLLDTWTLGSEADCLPVISYHNSTLGFRDIVFRVNVSDLGGYSYFNGSYFIDDVYDADYNISTTGIWSHTYTGLDVSTTYKLEFCNDISCVEQNLSSTTICDYYNDELYETFAGYDWSVDADAYGDITGWDVSCIDNMQGTFKTSDFNQDISGWNTSAVLSMANMFEENDDFNQDIGNWDISLVTDMEYMFSDADGFNQDIGDWDVSSVTDMSYFLEGNSVFNQDLSDWDVSSVTDMSQMFAGTITNQDVTEWDVSSVTLMDSMFFWNTNFNQDLYLWNVSQVTNMAQMFYETDMSYDLRDWCVQNVGSEPFNFVHNAPIEGYTFSSYDLLPVWGTCPGTPLDKWNLPCGGIGSFSGTNFTAQFLYRDFTTPYDTRYGNMEDWDVSCVDDFSLTFAYSDFNQDIGGWNVSTATTFQGTFFETSAFNQDIGSWDPLSVEAVLNGLDNMFNSADVFNQDLTDWCLPSMGVVQYALDGFDFNTGGVLQSSYWPFPGACPDNTPTFSFKDYEVIDDSTIKFRVNVSDLGGYDGDPGFTGMFFKDLQKVNLSNVTNIPYDLVEDGGLADGLSSIQVIVPGIWYHEYEGLGDNSTYNFTFCDANTCISQLIDASPQIYSLNATPGIHNVTLYANYTSGLFNDSETYFSLEGVKMGYNVTELYVDILFLGKVYDYGFCVDYGLATVCSTSTFKTLTNENEFDDIWETLLEGNGEDDETFDKVKILLGVVVLLTIIFATIGVFGRYNMELGMYGIIVVTIIGTILATLMGLFPVYILLLIIIGSVILAALKATFFNGGGEGR